MRNMQYWRLYCETCSTGGHSEEHAVQEVLVRKHAALEVILGNMQYWRSYWETCSTGGHIGKHTVLEVILGNMQYWRLYWET